eukprot:1047148-Amphidinium_carterae.1
MNWVVSFGKYEGRRVWIEQPNGRFAPPNLPDFPLRGEFHITHCEEVEDLTTSSVCAVAGRF